MSSNQTSRRPGRLVYAAKKGTRARFPTRPAPMSSPSARFEELLESSLNSDAPPKKISISSYKTTSSYTTTGAEYPFHPGNPYVPPPMPPQIPDVFRSQPVLRDEYQTKSQKDQDQTVSEVLPLITKRGNALPALKREKHIAFLEGGLDEEQLPSYMVILDASRPWIVYWCLTGQSILGVDVSRYRDQVISTFTPIQNATGGFGGGHGQISHLAGTYAAVLSLASVGGGALSLVNRISMLKWLHSIKNPDGSFKVCIGGETDVRGIYCALTAISILRLPTDNGLLKNTTQYLVSCQTYEGGFAATPGGNEAHGGYTFCALAALAILYPPQKLKELIDMDALLRWMSARQYGPEGGLSGRTNKLVDGCYSTWIGGCWPLIEAALGCETGSLWNREGLVRYIMAATQNDKGGLRDKPSKNSDFYHTNYVLLGLSGTQHRHWYEAEDDTKEWEEGFPLLAPFGWRAEETTPGVTGWETWPDSRWGDSKTDRVEAAHPVFNIKHEMVEETKKWAESFL